MFRISRFGKTFAATIAVCFAVACGQGVATSGDPALSPADNTPMTAADHLPIAQLMQAALVPDATTPCPPQTRPSATDDYARVNYLSEHPNPACKRDLVCVPLPINSSLPLCYWQSIPAGQEDRQVWIQLSSQTCNNGVTPGTAVDSRESDGISTWDAKFNTCTWNNYRIISGPTRTQYIETKAPADVPPNAPSDLARLRYTAARKFVTDTCPVTDTRTRNWPFNANCWLWQPARF